MPERGRHRLARFVQAATLAVGVVAIAVFAANVMRVASSVDSEALQREAAALQKGLTLVSELAAAETLSLTMWDEAYRNTTPSPSQAWLKRNFGRGVYSEPWEQRLALVDSVGVVAFDSSRDAAPAPTEAGAIVWAARPLLDRLDARYRQVFGEGDIDRRIDGGLVEGVYVTGFARINDRPALIVASPVLPDDGSADLPARPAVLLDIRYITAGFLARLGDMAHLEGVVIADTGSETTRPVTSVDGAPVVLVGWDHRAPGSAVLASMRPALFASVLVVLALAFFVGHLLRRQARALADSERAALYAARHDAATGLANRRWFMEEGERVSAWGDRAVVLIDCDYFKAINDTLGHAAGDAVLVAVAERLRALGPKLALSARLGGDEFAVITGRIADRDAIALVVDEIAEALMQPVLFEDGEVPVSVSIGAAPIAHGLAGSLPHADAALYRAKREGRGCWRLFDAEADMASQAVDKGALGRDPRVLPQAA